MDGEHIYLPQISISKNRMKQNDQNMSELESKSFWDKLHEENTCTKMNLVISFSFLDRFWWTKGRIKGNNHGYNTT